MKLTIKGILLALLAFMQMQCYGQLLLDDIKLNRVHQKKVRKYIECRLHENKHQFNEIRPSWMRGRDLSLYSRNEMSFFLNGKLQDIWDGYLSANPSDSWNGKSISFGVLLQKFPCNIFYNHDQINGVDTGQIYFLNLKLMFGLCNLPVAFEIITVDTLEKVIEFSYIEGNKSSGVQHIQFLDLGNNRTKILHISYFKSNSPFRDKWLYPIFHEKLINEFHRNMRLLLKLSTAKADSKIAS
jgi:hypothetical protein